MKYQSELIKEIVDTRGHEKSSVHYESECIEEWIKEARGAYPKLMDYKGEWLNYIVENPIGDFPYVTLSDVTEATVENVVPYAYKSAILKGNTKYRDIDTGEILETFEEGRNLELVSVKMPVLKTVGKNLYPFGDVNFEPTSLNTWYMSNGEKQTKWGNDLTKDCGIGKWFYLEEGNYSISSESSDYGLQIVGEGEVSATPGNNKSFKRGWYTIRVKSKNDILSRIQISNIQIEKNVSATSYDPYKTNILTVNEDVTLRSNGSVCDELDLLTGKLTQRIDEDGEILTQEVVKTVDLKVVDQNGNTLAKIKPIEGTMHLSTSSDTIKPSFTGEVPVEAIMQNLSSFIEE